MKAAGPHAGRRGDRRRRLEAHGGQEVMLAVFGQKLSHSPKYIKMSYKFIRKRQVVR